MKVLELMFTQFPMVSKASRMRKRKIYFPVGVSGPVPGISPWITGCIQCCKFRDGDWRGGGVRAILASSDQFRLWWQMAG